MFFDHFVFRDRNRERMSTGIQTQLNSQRLKGARHSSRWSLQLEVSFKDENKNSSKSWNAPIRSHFPHWPYSNAWALNISYLLACTLCMLYVAVKVLTGLCVQQRIRPNRHRMHVAWHYNMLTIQNFTFTVLNVITHLGDCLLPTICPEREKHGSQISWNKASDLQRTTTVTNRLHKW